MEQSHQRQEQHERNSPEDPDQDEDAECVHGLHGGACYCWHVEASNHDQDRQQEARSEVDDVQNWGFPWPTEQLKRHVGNQDALATQHLQCRCVGKEDHWECQQRSLVSRRCDVNGP